MSTATASQFFSLPFRKKKRYVINVPNEYYDVIYLGNVLTVMAKGEACVERPLSLIWKTYCSHQRPDLHMKLAVTRSGLKAETKQQGLTEYWAHRLTYCLAPPQYPRLFCWVYKHDGKRMKPELRCHAVLCRKSSDPAAICSRLTEFLHSALLEYKREKLCMQNARINSSANGQVVKCPMRKVMLQTGRLNFCPPVSRSKSSPRLGSISEADETEEIQEDEMSDLDSLCFRESPAGDDDCVSSATSSSSSSSNFTNTTDESKTNEKLDEGNQSEEEGSVQCENGTKEWEYIIEECGSGRVSLLESVDNDSVLTKIETSTSTNSAEAVNHEKKNTKDMDTVSDESGYHDIVASDQESNEDWDDPEYEIQVTAL